MRRLLLGAFLILGGLAAQPAAAALKVFACEPEWAALVTELGGRHVEVYSATTALQDAHRVQARPSLIARYRQADLLVCTGAELEIGWLPALAEKGNNPKLVPGAPGHFEASRHVTMLEVPVSVDRSRGDVHPYGNPHIQTSPVTIAKVAAPLAAKLAELDSAHADDYRSALQQFQLRWQEAMARWSAKAQPLRGVAVISAHRSWIYLYDWLGMREVGALEAKPGIPPSGAQLEQVLASLKSQPAKLVIYAAYQDRRPVEWLTQRAKIAAVELPMSPGGAPGTDSLFGLFDVTIDRLLQGLAAPSS